MISKSALEAFTVFAARGFAQRNPNVVMTMVSPGPTAIEGKYLGNLEKLILTPFKNGWPTIMFQLGD